MVNPQIIGSKIAEARKKMNISQAQLAARLFISAQAVGKWERGASMPDITTFNSLAEILGVDLNYFSENFPSAAPVAAAAATPPVEPAVETEPGNQQKKMSWDMSEGNWVDADFSGLKNLHERFSASNMQRCKFTGSDLSALLLESNHVENCDFSGSVLDSSHIRNSHITGSRFKACVLKETEFSGSHIKGCDFSAADFTGAVFKSCVFDKNIMTDAVLNHSSFIGVQLDDIVFDSKLEDCYFENCTFNWIKFQHATLIHTFFRNNRFKRIRIRFVDCKADNVTYAFLKSGGKADLTGITLLDT